MLRIAVALSLSALSLARAQDSTLHLPVRVHRLRSAESPALSATSDTAGIGQMLALANRIWAQAGIQWHLESVVHEDAPRGAVFDSLIQNAIPRARANPLTGFLPQGALLTRGWNLFLIHDFGQIAGGVFEPAVSGIILAERGMGYDLPAAGRGGATLAHELGHSLGLEHAACDTGRNIMANACWRPGLPSMLTADQIATARRQARTGRPATEIPGARVPPDQELLQTAGLWRACACCARATGCRIPVRLAATSQTLLPVMHIVRKRPT